MLIGQAEDFCPSCGCALDRRPKRKAKCPHCGDPIHVKTRPQDRIRVLVTKAQADALQIEWTIYPREIPFAIDPTSREFSVMSAALTKRFLKQPSEADVVWGCLNARTLKYVEERAWGSYSRNLLQLGLALVRERKHGHAMKFFLAHAYMALNGPINAMRAETNDKVSYEGARFDPQSASIPDYVVGQIARSLLICRFSYSIAFSTFCEEASYIRRAFPASLDPADLWQTFSIQLIVFGWPESVD